MGLGKPWNAADHPVYSLCTQENQKSNMNICTYVTPVSRNPRLFVIGLYHGTKTLQNMANSSFAVLQYLNAPQFNLVKLLGKSSGFDAQKMEKLAKKTNLSLWQGFSVLSDAAALLLLQKQEQLSIAGDHDLFIFKLVKTKTLNLENPLMFSHLKQKGIIL